MEKIKKLESREIRSGRPSTSAAAETSHEKMKRTAEKASNRQFAVEAVNRLLRIEVVNLSTIRMLSAPAYKCFMAEKIMTKIVSRTTDNIASNFNKVFFNSQFSRRAIANMYWGDDNRYILFLITIHVCFKSIHCCQLLHYWFPYA